MKRKKSSFTLIELIAAISIITILAAMTLGVYTYIRTKTYNDKTMATIKKVELAMRSFKHDNGYYIQQGKGSLNINLLAGYLPITKMEGNGEINDSGNLVDAWGNIIIYQSTGTGMHNSTMFDLISFGKNGVDNNGSDDDITNFTNY